MAALVPAPTKHLDEAVALEPPVKIRYPMAQAKSDEVGGPQRAPTAPWRGTPRRGCTRGQPRPDDVLETGRNAALAADRFPEGLEEVVGIVFASSHTFTLSPGTLLSSKWTATLHGVVRTNESGMFLHRSCGDSLSAPAKMLSTLATTC